MTIGLLASEADRPYITRFRELLRGADCKTSFGQDMLLASVAAKVKAYKLTTLICTNPQTLPLLLRTQLDFRHPVDKRGSDRKLALDDYAGSFFTIDGSRLGVDWEVDVLILNPLQQLVSTAAGTFIFKRFLSKVLSPSSWFPDMAFTWEVWTHANSEKLLAKFSTATLLSCDIETYVGDEARRIHCVGYAGLFADGSIHCVVVKFDDMVAHSFVRRLNATPVPKIFQNGMYDNLYFLRWGCPASHWLYDTQHLFHSWYAELPKRLDFITAFAVRRIRFWKDDAQSGGEFTLFEYNARDCWATLVAWLSMVREVPKWALDNYRVEFPLVFPCLHMEADGLRLDKDRFSAAKAAAEEAIAPHVAKLNAWIPGFNPGSPDQCKRLLSVLGVPSEAAGKIELIAAASVHPLNALIIGEILAFRKQAKLLSTYFVWEKFWNDRLYYKTNPAGTESGRLASTESSFWTGLQIQNIPQGPAVKSWICVDADWDGLAEGDYAQSEARCVGYMSGCTALIELVESDKDYHSWNAHKFFGVKYEEVTKDLRNLAKRVNHGSNYNMGAQVLLNTMGPKAVTEARRLLGLPGTWTLIMVCQHLLRTYEQAYPEVKKDWYNDIKRVIGVTKKLVSQLGWTRHFFADPNKSKPALNAAVAHGPQNLSVSIINQVFYKIWHDSVYGDLRGKVRLKAQIHDSLFFAWRGADTPEIVRARMRNPISVKDIKGVTRTMLIPPDMSCKDKDGNPAQYWSDMK